MPLITASTTARVLAQRNRLRKSILFQNIDASNVVYIKKERAEALTVSTTDFDHRIAAGATFALNSTLDGIEAIQDRWSVIASGGTPLVSLVETEDVVR